MTHGLRRWLVSHTVKYGVPDLSDPATPFQTRAVLWLLGQMIDERKSTAQTIRGVPHDNCDRVVWDLTEPKNNSFVLTAEFYSGDVFVYRLLFYASKHVPKQRYDSAIRPNDYWKAPLEAAGCDPEHDDTKHESNWPSYLQGRHCMRVNPTDADNVKLSYYLAAIFDCMINILGKRHPDSDPGGNPLVGDEWALDPEVSDEE